MRYQTQQNIKMMILFLNTKQKLCVGEKKNSIFVFTSHLRIILGYVI